MTNNALRAEVQHLTASISHQQKILDELHARLKTLQSRLDSLIYPVLTLPLEITSEIFVWCLPPEEEVEDTRLEDAPLILTRVCAAWKRIAISTPALWTRFCINLDAHSSNCLKDMTNVYLSRAGSFSLSLKLGGVRFDASQLNPFLSTLRRYTTRIKKLELHLGEKYFNPMGELFSSSFPLLEDLSIGNEEYILLPGTIFSQAPLLCHLTLDLVQPSKSILPWQQFTQCTAAPYYDDDCLELLRLTPNLAFCRFEVLRSINELPLVHHQNLEHLELIEDIDGILIHHLTLPALHSFHWAPYHVNKVDLDSFLQRSSPPLRKLTIQPQNSITGLNFSGAFARLPLTDLEIWHPELSCVTAFLQMLCLAASFLPQLSTLRFLDCSGHDDFGAVEMVQMAGSALGDRWISASSGGCARVVVFRVTIKSGVSPEALAIRSSEFFSPLRELKEKGVHIHIGSLEQSVI